MVFVDDVKLKVFHLFSEATSQGIHSMGAACRRLGDRCGDETEVNL